VSSIQLGAFAVIGTPNPGQRPASAREAGEPHFGTNASGSMCPIGFILTGPTACGTMAGARRARSFHPIAHAIPTRRSEWGDRQPTTVASSNAIPNCAPHFFLEGTAGGLYWWLWRLDDPVGRNSDRLRAHLSIASDRSSRANATTFGQTEVYNTRTQ